VSANRRPRLDSVRTGEARASSSPTGKTSPPMLRGPRVRASIPPAADCSPTRQNIGEVHRLTLARRPRQTASAVFGTFAAPRPFGGGPRG
jgi:hypothetical protein